MDQLQHQQPVELVTLHTQESDDSLEPPFEVHGIAQPTFHTVVPISRPTSIQDFQESDDENPPSMFFEQRPLIDTQVRERPVDVNQRRPIPLLRKRIQEQKIIENWNDVVQIDEFLVRIYEYYQGKGLICIILEQITNLLTVAFVVGLTIFLSQCIEYSQISPSKKLQDVIVEQCVYKYSMLISMSWFPFLITFSCTIWWLYQVGRLIISIPALLEIQNFVQHVLEISEPDLKTMMWSDVVDKIIASKEDIEPNHPASKLDAHSIANRIMRKENYLIALFNKEIFDLRVPLLGRRQWMTRLMQDYLSYCIFSFVFDSTGKFRKRFLKESNRHQLVRDLQQRFQMMGTVTLLFSPFLFFYLLIRSFFKMSEEYRQNPALLGSRSYSPYSLWKMREFNELPHLFDKRINRSYLAATNYMLQFPNHLVIILARYFILIRFVSFVSGSFATVLLIITLFEEDLQHGFDITPGRSAFFYIGLFGSILAATQGMTQENAVHEPQRWMNEIVLDTHYHPPEWKEKAHIVSVSLINKVRDQFADLFDYKLVLLLQEIFSILLAPFILYYKLPDSAPEIIDFFRECTVNVDAVGHVCSFAAFDFEKHGDMRYGAPEQARNQKYVSKNGKLEQSFLNFKANHPNWDPGVQGSQYLSRVLKRPQQRSHLGMVSHQPAYYRQPDIEIQNESYLPMESMMNSVHHGTNLGRELIGLLDAFYDANKRT
jgi:hypothetical protein